MSVCRYSIDSGCHGKGCGGGIAEKVREHGGGGEKGKREVGEHGWTSCICVAVVRRRHQYLE